MAQWHRRCPACLGAGLIPSSAGLIPSSAQFDSLWVKESSVATATWIGCSFGLDLIPGLGTPYAAGWPKKKKKDVAQEQTNRLIEIESPEIDLHKYSQLIL